MDRTEQQQRDQYYRKEERRNDRRCLQWIGCGLTFAIILGIVALIVGAIALNHSNSINSTSPNILCNSVCSNSTNGSNWTAYPLPVQSTGMLDFADFYGLMPGDNTATIGVGTDVAFPRLGPSKISSGITAINTKQFKIASVGVYDVTFFVSIAEAGQLGVTLNNAMLPYSITGRATGTSYISASYLITVTTVNSLLTIRNPSSNTAALTITPHAGGAASSAVSCHLKIFKIT